MKEPLNSPKGYLLEPSDHHINFNIGQYGRLAKAIVNGNEQRLPHANLGKTDIRIVRGTLLGYWRHWAATWSIRQ